MNIFILIVIVYDCFLESYYCSWHLRGAASRQYEECDNKFTTKILKASLAAEQILQNETLFTSLFHMYKKQLSCNVLCMQVRGKILLAFSTEKISCFIFLSLSSSNTINKSGSHIINGKSMVNILHQVHRFIFLVQF